MSILALENCTLSRSGDPTQIKWSISKKQWAVWCFEGPELLALETWHAHMCKYKNKYIHLLVWTILPFCLQCSRPLVNVWFFSTHFTTRPGRQILQFQDILPSACRDKAVPLDHPRINNKDLQQWEPWVLWRDLGQVLGRWMCPQLARCMSQQSRAIVIQETSQKGTFTICPKCFLVILLFCS